MSRSLLLCLSLLVVCVVTFALPESLAVVAGLGEAARATALDWMHQGTAMALSL